MSTRPCPACGRGVTLPDVTWQVMDETGIQAYACEGNACVAEVRQTLGYKDIYWRFDTGE